jgi:hypothetical protein
MQLPQVFSEEQRQAVQRLRRVDRRRLKTIFAESTAPNMSDMCGEYNAQLLHQGNAAGELLTKVLFGSSGDWIGKAFHPLGDEHGIGYNCFVDGGRVRARLHMDTVIAESRLYDGKSLIIDYRKKNWGLIYWLVGEIRQVVPGVFLGMGVYGPRIGMRDLMRRKIPFMMVGPVRDYQVETLPRDCPEWQGNVPAAALTDGFTP